MEPRLDLTSEVVVLALTKGRAQCANASCGNTFAPYFILWHPRHSECVRLDRHRKGCLHESAVCPACIRTHNSMVEERLDLGYVILSQVTTTMNINDIIYRKKPNAEREQVYFKGRVWTSKGAQITYRRVADGPGRANAADAQENFEDIDGRPV